MAACSRALWRVVSGCQQHSSSRPLYSGLSQTSLNVVPVRTAARLTKRKYKKEEKKEEEEKKVKRPPVIDDTGRRKPYGKTAWAPVDDVYILRHYPRPVYGAEEAVELLKNFRRLDFTPENQPVFIDLRLDMKLEKKKMVDPFVSTLRLPHPLKTEMNTVIVFTEDPNQAQEAQENGAIFSGGNELVQQILDDKISADFYVAVPEILPKLLPLKDKLRKKFPKSKRGSVGVDIPKMLDLFKVGYQYLVEDGSYVRPQIATLDMSTEHILENLRAVIADVCSHRPPEFGPFIERAIICSQTSEALWFRTEDLLPQTTEETTQETTDQ